MSDQQTELPPSQQILKTLTEVWATQAVSVAARLGIADLLRDGPRGAADLAKATSWHGDSLDLRMLVMSGGRERTPKEFRHLLVAADFKLAGIYPTDALQSIIESMPT